jgi:hypothetical protein
MNIKFEGPRLDKVLFTASAWLWENAVTIHDAVVCPAGEAWRLTIYYSVVEHA